MGVAFGFERIAVVLTQMPGLGNGHGTRQTCLRSPRVKATKNIGIDSPWISRQKRHCQASPIRGEPGATINQGTTWHGLPNDATRGGTGMIRAQTKTEPDLVADTACHDARDLTAGSNTAMIVLDGQVYTLRITRAGKLILTK